MSELEIKCGDCGASLAFKPGTAHLKCQYCGNENEIDGGENIVEVEELDLEAYMDQYEEQQGAQEVHTVVCSSCAAETSLEEGKTSGECVFCGTPLIVSQAQSKKAIKASYLLPFGLGKDKARVSFKEWIKGLWFAPNDLKKYATQNQKLKGIYLPFWTYDCDTYSSYSGSRGDNYTETRTRTNSEGKSETYTEIKTRWRSVSGSVSKNFDDILVSGTNSLPRDKQDELEPWDLENLVEYQESYLAGFVTESYQINLKEGYQEAKVRMDDAIRSAIRSDIGGDHQKIYSVSTSYTGASFKHILLPVWVSAYRYKEKVYQFIVNARTGEVQGDRPWSWVKITLAVLGGLAVIGSGVYLYMVSK